jgi:hypothetical protein
VPVALLGERRQPCAQAPDVEVERESLGVEDDRWDRQVNDELALVP